MLTSILKECKEQWIKAKHNKKHPFRFFTLATIASEGSPHLRTVVLRDFDSETLSFTIYTDLRSRKVLELEQDPTDPGEGHRGGDEDGSSALAGQGKDGSGQGRGSSGGVHGWVDNAGREASRGVGMGTVRGGGELTGEPNRGGARQTRGGSRTTIRLRHGPYWMRWHRCI